MLVSPWPPLRFISSPHRNTKDDDYAAYVLARELGKPANVTNFLLERALKTPFTLFNDATGFMEARNADGSWAGEDNGWTEGKRLGFKVRSWSWCELAGDKWAYSFDVVHDIPELIRQRGGNLSFVRSLEEHFDGGHNEHSNEVCQFVTHRDFQWTSWSRRTTFHTFTPWPELLIKLRREWGRSPKKIIIIHPLACLGFVEPLQIMFPAKRDTEWRLRPDERLVHLQCHGFLPCKSRLRRIYRRIVCVIFPGSKSSQNNYVRPFFEDISITLQGTSKKLHISAPGALTKPYIKSLIVNGEKAPGPIIRHEQIARGAEVVFEMSDHVERWGNDGAVLEGLGLRFNEQVGAQEIFEGWVDSESKATEKISSDRARIELWGRLFRRILYIYSRSGNLKSHSISTSTINIVDSLSFCEYEVVNSAD